MFEIDGTGIEIVKKLEKRRQASYRDIAEDLDVSEATVYNRIKRMQKMD